MAAGGRCKSRLQRDGWIATVHCPTGSTMTAIADSLCNSNSKSETPSTTQQKPLALRSGIRLLLGGTFGKNRVRGSTMVMLTASACDDQVRLSFVRSDLLLWTHSQAATQAATQPAAEQQALRITVGL